MGIGLQDNPDQKLICVDASGKETGRIVDRKTAHTAPGVKHLAIQILLFNSKKELILQERQITKVGGGTLDVPTTHVLLGEKPIESAARCLENEYGIKETPDIKVLDGFSYRNEYHDGTCENEYCLAAFAVYDGPIMPNKREVERIVRLPMPEVMRELITRPENFTVWLKETVRIVRLDSDGRMLFS